MVLGLARGAFIGLAKHYIRDSASLHWGRPVLLLAWHVIILHEKLHGCLFNMNVQSRLRFQAILLRQG